MESIAIEILGWEKYNPRKDVENPSWFRFQHSFFTRWQFYDFSHEECVAWLYLLCEASNRNQLGKVTVNFEHAHRVGRTSSTAMKSLIKKLKENQVITVRTLRGRYADVTDPCTTRRYETLRNGTERDDTEQEDTILINFDFESAYNRYPRKVGKTKGIEKLKKAIESQEDFEKLITSIENYAASRRGQDPQFTKHFSTFVSEWRDWVEFKPESQTPSIIAVKRLGPDEFDPRLGMSQNEWAEKAIPNIPDEDIGDLIDAELGGVA